MRVPLDLGPKLARADRSAPRPTSSSCGAAKRWAASARGAEGVRRADRGPGALEAVHKGERAGKAWVTAVAQNFAIGLAEARDFSDALLQSFKMRTFALQAVYDLNTSTATLSRATGIAVP